ncbi:AEC family transporter [Shimia sp.]|uniref:AEC family transporter n=1 Tax=Shimia sp. TaxID=1954381 RepID=UPI003298970C
MSDILAITFPIYAAIAIGYLVVARGWFAPGDLKVLGKYVMDIAMPALLFHAVASRQVSEVLRPDYMLIYAIGGVATIALSFGWFSMTAADRPRRAVAVMGSTCPNSGFIGYPMMLLLFPDLAGLILALNFLVEFVVIIPICLVLMELAKDRTGQSLIRLIGQVLLGVLKRPMVIGLLLGLVASLLQLPMPAPVSRLFQMLAASASALSLLVIGGALVGLPLKGNWRMAVQIAIGKLTLHPAMIALTAVAFTVIGGVTLPADMQAALILSAAMPMFGIYTVLAQEQGLQGAASIAALMATTGAFFTLSALLFVLT